MTHIGLIGHLGRLESGKGGSSHALLLSSPQAPSRHSAGGKLNGQHYYFFL